MIIKRKNILRIIIGTAAILMIPLVAMQFSDEWDWNLFDFIVIGTLLIGAGLTYELVSARANSKYRLPIAIAFAIAVILIWAELAVGLFGTPFAGS